MMEKQNDVFDVWQDLSIGLMAFVLTFTMLRWFAS